MQIMKDSSQSKYSFETKLQSIINYKHIYEENIRAKLCEICFKHNNYIINN